MLKKIIRIQSFLIIGSLLMVSMYAAQEYPNGKKLVKRIQKTIRVLDQVNGIPINATQGLMQALTVPVGSMPGIIGDLHGDIVSLREDFEGLHQEEGNFFQSDDRTSKLYYKLKPGRYLICTGDYVDRGYHGVEVLDLLAKLKRSNPLACFLLRGNHETGECSNKEQEGEICFRHELAIKYPFAHQQVLFDYFKQLWQRLPSAFSIGIKKNPTMTVLYMLFVHGSLEPLLIDRMNLLLRNSVNAPLETLVKETFSETDFPAADPALYAISPYPPTVITNGLIWGDNNPVGEPTKQGRGCGLFSLNVLDYLPILARKVEGGWSWRVFCLGCGHRHADGGVLRNTALGLEPMVSGCEHSIKENDVFTFISSPEALSPFSYDAYGVVKLGGNGWTITSYARAIRHCLGCSRINDANRFCQEAVANKVLYTLLLMRVKDQKNSSAKIAAAIIDSLKQNPELRVADFIGVNDSFGEDDEVIDFWQSMRNSLHNFSPFWQHVINDILDKKMAGHLAKDLLYYVLQQMIYNDGPQAHIVSIRLMADYLKKHKPEDISALFRLGSFGSDAHGAIWQDVQRRIADNDTQEALFLKKMIAARGF
jgi:hypothetical protein